MSKVIPFIKEMTVLGIIFNEVVANLIIKKGHKSRGLKRIVIRRYPHEQDIGQARQQPCTRRFG